jgi:hypothetical protein
MPKTPAEKKRINRANKRKAGYVLKQLFVKPEWWAKLKAYRDELDNNRRRL